MSAAGWPAGYPEKWVFSPQNERFFELSVCSM